MILGLTGQCLNIYFEHWVVIVRRKIFILPLNGIPMLVLVTILLMYKYSLSGVSCLGSYFIYHDKFQVSLHLYTVTDS